MGSSSRYAQLPQHRQSGAPSDIWRRENERYLQENEDINDPRARELVNQRRRDEYERRKMGFSRYAPRIAPTRVAVDLIDDVENMEWYSWALFHLHSIAFFMHAFLFWGMFIYIAIYHWAGKNGIGKFPIEDNFLQDVGGEPINDDRDVKNLHFAYFLILIPGLGMLYHGVLSTFGYLPFGIGRMFDTFFVTYFYDNILHHMGSLKYCYYSFAYAVTTFITLVLVGAVDIFLLLTLALVASIVYGLVHIGDWQFGKNMTTYRANLKNTKSSAVKAMASMVETMPASMFAGAKGNPSTAEGLAEIVDASITMPASIARDTVTYGGKLIDSSLQLSEDVIVRLNYVSSGLISGISNAVGAVVPPDQVISTYIWALIVQVWVHVVILTYYIEAIQNVGFHALQWYVTFAFVMHFLPTVLQIVVYVLYSFQWDEFNLYVQKEMVLIGGHTLGLCAFTLAIFIGTLHIKPDGVLYT